MPTPSDPQQVPRPRCWRLKPLGVSGWEGTIEPSRERLTLGRSMDNDVVLDPEGYRMGNLNSALLEYKDRV
mgnify:CR=1 FL=1